MEELHLNFGDLVDSSVDIKLRVRIELIRDSNARNTYTFIFKFRIRSPISKQSQLD